MKDTHKLTVRPDSHSGKISDYAASVLILILSIFIVGQVFSVANRGFDLTDEGWYLAWISNPEKYPFSVTQFGFVYHPIFVLLNGDIALLRVFNLLSLWALSSFLVFLTLSRYPSFFGRLGSLVKVTLALGVGSVSMAFFAPHWLVTPNYNSLNFLGILISFVGLHFSQKGKKAIILWGVFFTALGISLSFFAKPTSGAALGVAIVVSLLIRRKRDPLIVASVALTSASLVVLFGFFVDGSMITFLERYVGGAEIVGQQDPRYTLDQVFRFDTFIPTNKEVITFLGLFVSSTVLLQCMRSANFRAGKAIFGSLMLVFTLIFATSGTSFFTGFSYSDKSNLVLLAPCLALMFVAIKDAKNRFSFFSQSTTPRLLLLAPLIMAIGTNGNYWWSMSLAVMFWILAGVEITISMHAEERPSYRHVAIVIVITQLATLIFLANGALTPYRNDQSLKSQLTAVQLGPNKSELLLSENFSEYIRVARARAEKAGFTPDTPIIDLTGQSPGLLFALDAQNSGLPWLIGGYYGSNTMAVTALESVSCQEISEAWVLLEPGGPRSLDSLILDKVGLEFPLSHEPAARWFTPKGAGGYSYERQQILYRPTDVKSSFKSCLGEK